MSDSNEESPSADIKFSIASRTFVRKRITTLYNKILAEYNTITKQRANTYLGNVVELGGTVSGLNEKIARDTFHCSSADSSEFLSELEKSASYDDKLTECKSLLTAKLAELSVSPVPVPNITLPTDNSARLNKLKLPEIPLPTYSHSKNETLSNFLSSFESIISKYT